MSQQPTVQNSVASEDAIAALKRLQDAIREDGFDVAQAPDGLWYWADEQDREEVKLGDHFTELHAWRDLATARMHVAEEAGIDPTAVLAPYFHLICSPSEVQRHNGHGFWHRRAGWTTFDKATLYTVDQVEILDLTAFANDAALEGYQEASRVSEQYSVTEDLQEESPAAPGM